MSKIEVAGTVVELDGDEMARVMWRLVKERLILPNLDVDIEYYDLSIDNRDTTDDRVTAHAVEAIQRHGVGIKCATITPDEDRVEEFGLKKMWRSPNGTIRHALGGTIFRAPIVSNVPRRVPGWTKPIVIARHAFGDRYRAMDFRVPGPGTVTINYSPKDGGEPTQHELVTITDSLGGVVQSQYNLDRSVVDFARASFEFGLQQNYPVYLSTGNTILKAYDGRFKDTFRHVYETEFEARFDAAGLTYEHRLVDDMVASSMKWDGGYVWACKNYDGDVQSAAVAQGYGSLGMMTSVLLSPDGGTYLAETAHGTVARHYRRHRQGEQARANPVASIFAWTRGLAHRGRLDDNPDVVGFANALERVAVDTVDSGRMTRDLAVLVGDDQHDVSTVEFIDAVAENLQKG